MRQVITELIIDWFLNITELLSEKPEYIISLTMCSNTYKNAHGKEEANWLTRDLSFVLERHSALWKQLKANPTIQNH